MWKVVFLYILWNAIRFQSPCEDSDVESYIASPGPPKPGARFNPLARIPMWKVRFLYPSVPSKTFQSPCEDSDVES